jgi:hypothetical protein
VVIENGCYSQQNLVALKQNSRCFLHTHTHAMVKKDDEMSVSSEAKGPLKSFQALMGEGEKFSRDKLYSKAIQSYTEVNLSS